MILKALYDYFYSRPDRVPEGMCRKEIEYVIVIDRDGSFVRFESRRIDKKRCAELIVAAPVKLGRQMSLPTCCGTTASMCLG